jgi:predicted MFS family arabinose efflux permease
MGVSEAFYLPAALAAIADWHGPETRSLATGIHQSGLYAGAALGGVLGGWMGQNYGWRPSFVILGVVGVLYFTVLAFVLQRDRARGAELRFGSSLAGLVRTRGFLPLAAAFGTVSVSNWLIYTWLPLFLYERFRMTLGEAGFYATVFIQVASYIGVVVGGTLTDRWAAKTPRARVLCQIIGVAVTAPLLIALTLTGSRLGLAGILILIGLCRPLFDINTMPVLRQIAPSEWCATGYGIFNMVGCFAGGLAALFAGYLKQSFGLAAAYQVAALVLILGALALSQIPARRAETDSIYE